MGARLTSFALLVALGQPVFAQEIAELPPSPVLIINTEALFVQTQLGRRIAADLEADAAALKIENERIVAALTEEERSLTQRRPAMTPEAFQAEAAAFDTKVQEIRRARDSKEAELQNRRVAARAAFEEQSRVIVGRLMIERGAYVVLDGRSVVLAVRTIDATEDAILRIDAELGDGSISGPQPEPSPDIEAPVAPMQDDTAND